MGKEKETALPKNIRQIGEIRGAEKICIEDYVMTCIHKKEPQEKDGYLGIFYGEQRKEEDGIYLFLRGILEIPDGEEEAVKKELEEQKEKYFPDWDVQGCCVIGQYPTERMKLAEKLNPMSMQLIYHLQEQEENLYWTVEGCYKKLRGYFVFYEQNRRMQQYLADEFKEDRVEKESIPDKAIKSFREKVRIKGEKRTGSMLKLASSFFVVAALVIGAIAVTRMDDIRKNQAGSYQMNTEENEADRIYTNADSTAVVQGGNRTASDGFAAKEAAVGTESEDGSAVPEDAGGSAAVDGNEAGTPPVLAGGDEGTEASAQSVSAGMDEGTGASAQPVSAGMDEGTGALAQPASSGTGNAQIDGAAADTNLLAGAAVASEPGQAVADGGTANPATAAASNTGASDSATTGEDARLTMAASAAAQGIHASYTIRMGDTLADICNQYYGSLDKLELLCQVNHISDANLIMPGQRIVLP
ncbi:MAG: LysM peptidoglycan-binding domain-containing protein [Lachnospiraceae bacterium]|nr:LysM peptidoglycan-binding domain-containing protein [Lachnospiraceae bacterium]